MPSCCVENCKSSYHKNPKISLHRFPANENLRKLWKSQLCVQSLEITPTTFVCSRHFTLNDYNKNIRHRKLKYSLKAGAIPLELPPIRDDVNGEDSREDCEVNVTDLNIEQDDFDSYVEMVEIPEIDMPLDSCVDTTHEISDLNIQQDGNDSSVEMVEIIEVDMSEDSSLDSTLEMNEIDSEQQNSQKSMKGEINSTYVEELKAKNLNLEQANKALRIENRNLKQKLRRKTQKLDEMLPNQQKMKKKKVSESSQNLVKAYNLLKDRLPGILSPLTKRAVDRGNRSTFPKKYDEKTRRFAIELDFNSPRAYKLVRTNTGNLLPHQRTIAKWYENLDCHPGFTTEALSAVKAIADAEKSFGRSVVCQMSFDEMYVRKQVQNVGEMSFGRPIIGGIGKQTPGEEKAEQILVFMLVCLDGKWAIPIAYFPLISLNGDQKAALIQKAIYLVEETGVKIIGLTFDGASANFTAMKKLGVDLKMQLPAYQFSPCLPQIQDRTAPPKSVVYVYPDPCHMLKLIRNTFGNYVMMDEEHNTIEFKYVVLLHQYQSSKGCNLGNHLTEAHIHFEGDIMNVRLAAQVLSESVARGIDICRDQLQLPEFAGSEGTSKFLRIMNSTFDVLNSRFNTNNANKTSFGLKEPICERNHAEIEKFCEVTSSYINELIIIKDDTIQHVLDSANFRGFAGLRACLINIPQMYDSVKDDFPAGMMTYPLNQDHLELFFGKIRTKLGSNTSPSVIEFRAAYKRLLTYVQITPSSGTNCLADLMDIKILKVKMKEIENPSPGEAIEIMQEICPQDNINSTQDDQLDPAQIVAVKVIAESILHTLQKSVECQDCASILTKCKGKSSDFLISLCCVCEVLWRQKVRNEGRGEALKNTKINSMINVVKARFEGCEFEHFIECKDHCDVLQNKIATLYCNKRLNEENRKFNEVVSQRPKIHRVIHFNNW